MPSTFHFPHAELTAPLPSTTLSALLSKMRSLSSARGVDVLIVARPPSPRPAELLHGTRVEIADIVDDKIETDKAPEWRLWEVEDGCKKWLGVGWELRRALKEIEASGDGTGGEGDEADGARGNDAGEVVKQLEEVEDVAQEAEELSDLLEGFTFVVEGCDEPLVILPGQDALRLTIAFTDIHGLQQQFAAIWGIVERTLNEQHSAARRLIPLFDRVLIQKAKPVERTKSGIYIPEKAQEVLNEGVVISAGPGAVDDKGKIRPCSVKAGDRVLLPEYGATQVKFDGQEFLLLRDGDLLAKLE